MVDPAPFGRKCPACGAVENVAKGEAIWPLNSPCARCGYVVPSVADFAMFAAELADTASGFDPTVFDKLASIEAEHFWFVARNRLIIGLINKYFPEAKRFMEVGCGTGFVLRAILQSRGWERVVGSELHPTGLRYARKRLPSAVELVQMDARHIPAAGFFDLAGAFDVIEHIQEDEAVLRGIHASLRPGAGIVVAVPQHPSLWSKADEIAHHVRRYRRGELEAKFRRNGFEVLFSSSYTALLLPLFAASRLKKARDDDPYEFIVNPLVNRILVQTLLTEVRLTIAGMRWPLGGSRIVVGRAL